MVTNREFVRKKWEDLMRNPLAKELWVTEAANFYDPTYHPLLHLVIDSLIYGIRLFVMYGSSVTLISSSKRV